MKAHLLAVFVSLSAVSFGAPHPNRLEARQKDVTFTITCLGPKCTDYPPTTIRIPTTIPGGGPQPPKTTKEPEQPSTSKKPSSTSKYTPPPETSKKPSTTSKYTPPPETSKKSSTTTKYTPPPEPPTKTIKSTQKPTKTEGGEVGPSSTRCPVPLYYQCGGYYDGVPWTGCTKCVSGAKCVVQNEWYDQCVSIDSLAEGFAEAPGVIR
ncbi:carbohydrate-binding module family 1 protein [Aaosphaeria arxii CBS 175.79]|uniref:Carbohydrate-binding module family 1 protein n=1 Tax=Aaosphaeria arxii CBS 175.79 TaxID=1450172 RepID=A0A6A5XVL5_9PLEO|nr:carbohydrate-binding module family 1 protein [Aaosphaeria arxii CBS 175.79]KAF2017252.1 carbohydrate-binding module family 1 protein [Aaosphaeria arxii CBS 175.79]